MKIVKIIITSLGTLVVLFLILVWLTTYHPADLQSESVICPNNAPLLKPGQKLKVLSWNVQFMAGKNYLFFYDLPNNSGPDERPSSEDIEITIIKVARIISDENPDIILLQELDDGAKRTDYQNQLKCLLKLLPGEYMCHTSAFYWKAAFIPHPRIMGKTGMKLTILSKYKIEKAFRHQLALIPGNPIIQQFHLKRAVLDVRMPMENTRDFVVLNTHLDAFAQGTNTLQKQVQQINSILEKLNTSGFTWIIGGDFNLLPPGKAYNLLKDESKTAYKTNTEIQPLFEKYKVVPSYDEVNGPDYQKWFTHFPNDPSIKMPDKTIDYVFLSNNIQLERHFIRQYDTLDISDHLPLIIEFEVPLD